MVFALPVFECQLRKKKERAVCSNNKYSKWCIRKLSAAFTQFWAMHLCKNNQAPQHLFPYLSFLTNQDSENLLTKSQILTCATLIPVQKLMFPRGCTACSLDRILAVSGVSVVNTSQLLQRGHFCYTFTFLQACMYNSLALFSAVTLPWWSGPRCFQGCCVFWCGKQRSPRPAGPEALSAGSLHSACTHYCPH